MVTITITGSRNEGKTAVAIAIARMLREKGQNVQYRGCSPSQTRLINQIIDDEDDPALLERRTVRLIDEH
jgi:molybdopterin-guanine dinucleotide biosynthesis protein